MIDIRKPQVPTFSGCYGDDGYVHDAQCVVYDGPDTKYQNKEICFCYNEGILNSPPTHSDLIIRSIIIL